MLHSFVLVLCLLAGGDFVAHGERSCRDRVSNNQVDSSITLSVSCSSTNVHISWTGNAEFTVLVQYDLYCYDESSDLIYNKSRDGLTTRRYIGNSRDVSVELLPGYHCRVEACNELSGDPDKYLTNNNATCSIEPIIPTSTSTGTSSSSTAPTTVTTVTIVSLTSSTSTVTTTESTTTSTVTITVPTSATGAALNQNDFIIIAVTLVLLIPITILFTVCVVLWRYITTQQRRVLSPKHSTYYEDRELPMSTSIVTICAPLGDINLVSDEVLQSTINMTNERNFYAEDLSITDETKPVGHIIQTRSSISISDLSMESTELDKSSDLSDTINDTCRNH